MGQKSLIKLKVLTTSYFQQKLSIRNEFQIKLLNKTCILFIFEITLQHKVLLNMQNQENHLQTLSEIKSLMERSSRFISLSGLSGVAAGTVALVGAWAANQYAGIPFMGEYQTRLASADMMQFIILDFSLVLLDVAKDWLAMSLLIFELKDFSVRGFSFKLFTFDVFFLVFQAKIY